jgi:cob(I)alamin adenosyltransferase
MTESEKGLLMVLTGNGKGKTTSALGQAIRAAGHGMRVCFIQFIKGAWKSGEMEAMKRFEDLIEFRVMGRGFTWQSDDLKKDREAAAEAWQVAKDAISSGKYSLVVLDEFTYVLNYGMIEAQEALAVFEARPPGTHVLVTGRDANEKLVETADLVTWMKEIKHPYQKGGSARKGMEF